MGNNDRKDLNAFARNAHERSIEEESSSYITKQQFINKYGTGAAAEIGIMSFSAQGDLFLMNRPKQKSK